MNLGLFKIWSFMGLDPLFELEDVISYFLMKLGNKQSFGHPKAAGNLINMFHVQEGIAMLLHGLKFAGPIIG